MIRASGKIECMNPPPRRRARSTHLQWMRARAVQPRIAPHTAAATDGYANKSAPLSKWQVFGKSSGLTDRNSTIASNQFAVNGQVGQISRAAVPSEALAAEMMSAECVESDDPRLIKGNDETRHAAALALVGWYMMVPQSCR
jgi:hypothetical protein